MLIKIKYLTTVILLGAVFSCKTDNKNNGISKNKLSKSEADSLKAEPIILKESYHLDDLPENEYLIEKLSPIRKNFKRINSIINWASTIKKELSESTEGGEATYYYNNDVLEKITTRNFGESFQELTEYYLLNGQLSFVFEKSYRYNRPVYYDSAAMKTNNDNQAFNFDKSEITENRSYFDKGSLIHQLNNQDCGSPFDKEYLKDKQIRILKDYTGLLKLLFQVH
jgi:hypothetical protein